VLKRNKHISAKRYNTIPLEELGVAVLSNKRIDISNQDAVKAAEIVIIKRDGRKESFQPEKMRNVCVWATDNRDWMVDELISDTEIKLHKEIHIKDMYQQLIHTAVNKISMLQPSWEDVAAKLYLMGIYKETYNVSTLEDYPHISDVLTKGLEHKIYERTTILSYTIDEINEINDAIEPKRDLLFNYSSIVTFFDKYCLNYSKTKKLELPQHSYMRVALSLMVNEEYRVKRVIQLYNAISQHHYTKATPIMLNALTPGQQLSSCVLNTVDDDSHSILDTGKNLGIYSKYKGGTALDISSIRAKGGYIEGTQGYSSGPVPFIKYYESIMRAWNQGGKRCVPNSAFVNKLSFISKIKGIKYIYNETLISDIKENDYIESYNIEEKKYEPQKVIEIIKSHIPNDKQIKFITKYNELTVSESTRVYTDSGYKIAGEVLDKDKLLIQNEWVNISISKDNKPSNFIDLNILKNNNFVVANDIGQKILIHNSGALAIYFNWWHLDVLDILSLKSNGGTDENRARGLQYAIKLNMYFINAVIYDEEVTLFDSKDVPNLIGKYGNNFYQTYKHYISKTTIRNKKIKARKIWQKIFKERSETGSIYLFHEENVNEASLLNRYIGSSNLCLAGDTLISTDKGTKELKDMKRGDIVKSYNITTNEIEMCKVTNFALMNSSAKVIKITDELSGKSITCTPEHQIWTENRGYVMAKDLEEIDLLYLK